MIIILFPYRFNNYYYKKYQIKELKKKFKNKIEVHDIFNIISKNWYKGHQTKRSKFAIIFNSIFQWENHIKEIIKKNDKVFVINTISSNSIKSLYIHYLLYKYNVKIIKLNSPEVHAPSQSDTLYLKILSFFKILFFNFPRFLFLFRNFFYSKLLYFLKFDEVFILFSGSKKFLLTLNLNSKKKFYIDYHSSDFANFLSGKKKHEFKNKKNFIIFLDIKAPAFPGDDVSLNDKIIYDVKKWYNDLNNFLDKVQKLFRKKVIIIPHPSVRKFKNIHYDKKFMVSKNPDASNLLIQNCKFVIANGATTAVSYCVIHEKPVTFMYNNQVTKNNPTMLFETTSLCKILSSKTININNRVDKKKFCLKINKKKYLEYKYNYLTSKKIKNLKNSEILKRLVS
tara:strand:+ start:1279 stop:2466 length:1188 start_codon:yes stop_codon:yes gene_type:complete